MEQEPEAFADAMAPAEVAQAMGLPNRTTAVVTSRAVKALRRELEADQAGGA